MHRVPPGHKNICLKAGQARLRESGRILLIELFETAEVKGAKHGLRAVADRASKVREALSNIATLCDFQQAALMASISGCEGNSSGKDGGEES